MRLKIHVSGIVQGVGFRPHVHTAASRLGISGWVMNTGTGVEIEAQGEPDAVSHFVECLRDDSPPLATVETVTVAEIEEISSEKFEILDSSGGTRNTLISPDIATCSDCLREMNDPSDRRYRYPFINCTNCGPRYTIIEDVPYDRAFTTMKHFQMCPDCDREYHDPSDRRYHAQPVACPVCGPALSLLSIEGSVIARRDDALAAAAEMLRNGAVVAVKGIGGFHLACSATDDRAVADLRSRKVREDKPFAVMCRDIESSRELCELSPEEEKALSGTRRPIVLCVRKPDAHIADQVAPGNRFLGLMLPYTPLHHMLLEVAGGPHVMTSGNMSDEPIAYRDEDFASRLHGIPDAYLTHDRRIHIRCDDSVARVWRGKEMVLRRARGYAPAPLLLSTDAPEPILAFGAELKSTFCILRGRHAFISHHIGDLDNIDTLASFEEGISYFENILDARPSVFAYDMHPEYLSTKIAHERGAREMIAVQHHHAHLASCLADNAYSGPVIGVVFDGLGYGLDGMLWGGEWLVGDVGGFVRAAHLRPLQMPGGAACIKQPWRMAVSALSAADEGDLSHIEKLFGGNVEHGTIEIVRDALEKKINTPLTTSMGRIFDAVSAIVTGRTRINYEGQAAIELERVAREGIAEPYTFDIIESGVPEAWGKHKLDVSNMTRLQVDFAKTIMTVAGGVIAGEDASHVSARFHSTVAAVVLEVCGRIAACCGIKTVALTGGVFQNVRLLEESAALLESAGFDVLVHSRVPCNDGGISLGQAVVAANFISK